MKERKYFQASGILAAAFVLLILCVRLLDVAAAGPAGTRIGLSHFNLAVHHVLGVHMALYSFTGLMGVLALLTVAGFAVLGLLQLVQRRSLLRVDGPLLALGGLYGVTAALYVFFEKVIINYRPILMAGETVPEASFPSSHTMLACVAFGGAAMCLGRMYRSLPNIRMIRTACVVLIVVSVCGRLFSGVHWATDILGGVLISAALLCLYAGILEWLDRMEKRQNSQL